METCIVARRAVLVYFSRFQLLSHKSDPKCYPSHVFIFPLKKVLLCKIFCIFTSGGRIAVKCLKTKIWTVFKPFERNTIGCRAVLL